MADKTGIQWTDATWNPVTGCDRVSPGCAHCYALDLAARLKKMGSVRYQKDGKSFTSGPGFGVTLHYDLLDKPIRWTRPRRIFVNSMSDLFHEEIPDSFIDEVFYTMARAQQHTFQVLTKRPMRMIEWANRHRTDHDEAAEKSLGWDDAFLNHYPNVWLGVSVESQYWADRRIAPLMRMPAAVRFLSCEPLLGPVDIRAWLEPEWDRIGWVIAGGESGPHWRPTNYFWVAQLQKQCADAGVPFFFKQWGGRTPKSGGRELDGRTWDEYPEVKIG